MPTHMQSTRRSVAALGVGALALAGVVVLASPAAADGPTTFDAPAEITIPGQNPLEDLQPASPYPSTLTVSGMAGTLTDVDVTLHGVTHGILNDVDVLLVAPDGSNLVVLSDLGGQGGISSASNAELTFSDGAAALVPANPVASGTYAPTDTDVGETVADDFSPGGGPAPSAHTTFADAFGGLVPNGTWSLYVIDDTDGDTGEFAGGWSLTLTTLETAQPGLLAFAAAEYRGTEGDGTIDVVVQRTGGTDGEVSALVTTSNGTAVGGTDYTHVSQMATFADGEASAVVGIPVIDDADPGGDVFLTVTLSDPAGGAQLGSRTTARVVIENDDGPVNPTGIVIPTSGPADPYPSNLHLSGLGTFVTDVDVVLSVITHSSSTDLDVLLVGPSGQTVMLLSDVGGADPTVGVTLTFDDDAATPVTAPLVSGTFQPTDNDLDGGGPMPDAAMPAPAPAEPYGASLAVFDGTNPNGAWRLFVVDDATGDSGRIDGWFLDVTTATVDAGGPYTTAEGALFSTLEATTDLPGASYAWDLDNDGVFDAFGATPLIGAGAMATFGLGDGPTTATITLQATNGTVTLTDAATVTISNVAPTGTLANDGPVLIGEPVTLTLSDLDDASEADAAAGLGYGIDWDGDGTDDASGTWATGDPDPTIVVPGTAFSTVGDHDLVVTVTDKDGGATDLPTTVVVGATTPTATFGSSGPVPEGGTGTVTFADPVDPAPGATFTYSFDLDDDGSFDIVDAADPSASLPAALTADGPATLTVGGRISNQYGGFTDYTTDVVVENVAPSATLTNDGPAMVGEPVTLTLGDPSDPSTADMGAGLEYAIDWDGDGTDDAAGTWVTGDPDPTITVPAAAFGTVGAYVLDVTLTDRDGGTADLSTTVVVGATTPTATLTSSGPVPEGGTATVTFSDPVDPDPGATFTYSFDLDGDGTFDVVDATAATAVIPAALTSDGPATLIVTGRISNQHGGFSDYTTEVEVTSVGPTVTVSTPERIEVGEELLVVVTIDDPSPADRAADFELTIDFGDGPGSGAQAGSRAPIAGPTATLTVGAGTTEVSHVYTETGTYTLSVIVVDVDGTATTITQQVTAEPAATAPPAQPPRSGGGGPGGLPGTGVAPALLLLAALLAIGLGIGLYRRARA